MVSFERLANVAWRQELGDIAARLRRQGASRKPVQSPSES
jgi:hypothetical protein